MTAPSEAAPPRSERIPWFRWLEATAWIATATGIFLTFLQLMVATMDRRADAALSYAEAFSKDDLGEYRRMLTRSYIRHAPAIRRFRTAAATDDAVTEFVKKTILSGDTPKETAELRLAVLEIADMFDQIELCVAHDRSRLMGPRCDPGIIAAYFCVYSVAFDDLYQGVLRDMARDFGSDLGSGVRAIARGDLCSD